MTVIGDGVISFLCTCVCYAGKEIKLTVGTYSYLALCSSIHLCTCLEIGKHILLHESNAKELSQKLPLHKMLWAIIVIWMLLCVFSYKSTHDYLFLQASMIRLQLVTPNNLTKTQVTM